MKRLPPLSRLITAAMCIAFLAAMNPARAYVISLRWMSDNPMTIPIGQLVSGDLGDASFEDLQAFFSVNVSAGGDDPDELRILAQLRHENTGNSLFTVYSKKFRIADLFPPERDNRYLAANIELGAGQMDVGVILEDYVDGGRVSEGLYTITVYLAESSNWDDAVTLNYGMATLSIYVRNPTQLRLEQPWEDAVLAVPPIFIWSFPREPGVRFQLMVVSGDPAESDPSNALEFASPASVYLDTSMTVEEWQQGGELTAYVYTGTGAERPLDPDSTYFWGVAAYIPTAFPGEMEFLQSEVYSFLYLPSGEGGAGAGGEENPPPAQEAPIFTFLRQILTPPQFEAIASRFDDLSRWSLSEIRHGDEILTLEQLSTFLSSLEQPAVLVTVTE